MKKSFVSLLTIAAITFGMVSCNSSKKQDAAEQKVEEEAAIAGEVSKGLLTAELKDEVTRFLKDMPDSELPYKVSTGEVTISVANTDFMLPVSKVSELNTQAQKARACGIYFADLNVLKAMKKPTTDIENVLVKLTTDLDIPFAIDIMKESSKEELSKFMKDQENKLIDAMMENDKADVELELLGGMAVEYAIVYANPGLVVKGDAISAGLSENMEKRIGIIQQITADLAKYYPDLEQLGTTIAPLSGMVATINMARESKAKIEEMRANLLK
jgi:flagellar hook-basal body complex protein FliE